MLSFSSNKRGCVELGEWYCMRRVSHFLLRSGSVTLDRANDNDTDDLSAPHSRNVGSSCDSDKQHIRRLG